MNKARVYKVAEFNDLVRDSLSATFGTVVVQGEITGFRQRSAGNKLIFFEIKDESSRLTVFMLDYQLDVELEDGMEVQVIGSPSLFKKNSGFHLRAVKVRPVGEGALAKALQLLKNKLIKEGLFAPERKRSLPRFPGRIGLITSPDAAAYNDVLRVLNNRWTGMIIEFFPVQVQGDASVGSILQAFKYFQKSTGVEAIILTRGGGSLEDLQSFNSEKVARAIFASDIPVVVGVGHERDWSIADLVADFRAATPSNAAESVTPDKSDILSLVNNFELTIYRQFYSAVETGNQRLSQAIGNIVRGPRRWQERYGQLRQSMRIKLSAYSQTLLSSADSLTRLNDRLCFGIKQSVRLKKDQLTRLLKLLKALSPQATMDRGYSITYGPANKPLKKTSQIKTGDKLRTRLASGNIISETKKTYD
ncbi:exodeoxyribonuclease VII large subunit [Patescibacteria group bacterium]